MCATWCGRAAADGVPAPPVPDDGQPAEHPLVDEPQLALAVQAHPHPQVPLGGGVQGLHQQLAAHPEVHEQGLVGVELEPQVLAPAHRVDGDGPPQPGRQIRGTGQVAAHRPGVQDLDGAEPGADHPAHEAAPHHLDLGQLGHGL
jgi:hypothetical protein